MAAKKLEEQLDEIILKHPEMVHLGSKLNPDDYYVRIGNKRVYFKNFDDPNITVVYKRLGYISSKIKQAKASFRQILSYKHSIPVISSLFLLSACYSAYEFGIVRLVAESVVSYSLGVPVRYSGKGVFYSNIKKDTDTTADVGVYFNIFGDILVNRKSGLKFLPNADKKFYRLDDGVVSKKAKD